jgi:hypothetical protein
MQRAGQAGRGGTQRRERLDRFLGDALIGAMILLGLVFCVGAARAQQSMVSGEVPRAEITQVGVVFSPLSIYTSVPSV